MSSLNAAFAFSTACPNNTIPDASEQIWVGMVGQLIIATEEEDSRRRQTLEQKNLGGGLEKPVQWTAQQVQAQSHSEQQAAGREPAAAAASQSQPATQNGAWHVYTKKMAGGQRRCSRRLRMWKRGLRRARETAAAAQVAEAIRGCRARMGMIGMLTVPSHMTKGMAGTSTGRDADMAVTAAVGGLMGTAMCKVEMTCGRR